MPGIASYVKDKLLDLAFSATAWGSKPTTVYFALLSTAPTDAGGGTELTGSGYARVSKTTSGSSKFTVSTNGVTNADAISFPTATADWGTATHVGVYDASSGGNLLYWSPIGAPRIIVRGDSVSLDTGVFSVTLTGNWGAYMANKLLLHLFNATAMPTIATHYFALGTSATSTGVAGEPSTNAYARASAGNDTTTWPASSSSSKSNGIDIAFPTASGSWGSLNSYAIMDASSSGNCIWFGTLAQARTPINTDTPKIIAASLTVTED